MLRLYRLIATMDAKAPLPLLADQQPTWATASRLARTWGLNQLADRFGGEDMTVVVRNVAEMDFLVRQWADDRAPQRSDAFVVLPGRNTQPRVAACRSPYIW